MSDGFPFSRMEPVAHAGRLPQSVDVAVVGGGIIGVMSAYWLARAGQRVVLVDKGRIAAEQSGRNWGWIRQQGRDPAELPVMVEARRHWCDLAPQLDVDIGLHQGGTLYLAQSAARMAAFEQWLPHARDHGLDTKLLTGLALAQVVPGAQGSFPGGLWTASDMRAEPWLAVPALARLAARAGATIRESCAARALDLEGGRIAGVVTEAGRIRAGAVVVAGGAWSRLLLSAHGVALPQLSVRASVAATAPLPLVTEAGVGAAGLAFRRRADGGYTFAPAGYHELFLGPDAFASLRHYLTQVRADPFGTRYRLAAPRGYPDAWGTARRPDPDRPGPFEAMRVLDPAPNLHKLEGLKQKFAQMYPDLPPVRFRAVWAGMIDTMPDIVPVIDKVASIEGLTIATGMSGHGFGIGPGVGRVVADLVMGKASGHDLHRFRLARFSDGTRMDLGPAL